MDSQQMEHTEIKEQYTKAYDDFHRLVNSLNDSSFHAKSLNPGWTNGEIIAHMAFGFIVVNALLPMARFYGILPKGFSKPLAWLLNAMTKPFNWINMMGARIQGRVFTYPRIGKIFDAVFSSLMKQIISVKDNEWDRGMYYPSKWDSNFDEYMTIKKLLLYPIIHFNFHLTQIAW